MRRGNLAARFSPENRPPRPAGMVALAVSNFVALFPLMCGVHLFGSVVGLQPDPTGLVIALAVMAGFLLFLLWSAVGLLKQRAFSGRAVGTFYGIAAPMVLVVVNNLGLGVDSLGKATLVLLSSVYVAHALTLLLLVNTTFRRHFYSD